MNDKNTAAGYVDTRRGETPNQAIERQIDEARRRQRQRHTDTSVAQQIAGSDTVEALCVALRQESRFPRAVGAVERLERDSIYGIAAGEIAEAFVNLAESRPDDPELQRILKDAKAVFPNGVLASIEALKDVEDEAGASASE